MPYLHMLIYRSFFLIFYRSYIPTEFLINDQLKYVYIPIPKVACSSLKTALFFNQPCSEESQQCMSIHRRAAETSANKLTKIQTEYFLFSFVRNPLSRLVSCYEDKVRRPIQHNGRYFFETNYNRVIIKAIAGDTFHKNMTFDSFVRLVSKVPDFLSDGHFRSQTSILSTPRRYKLDYVGKFENLADEWKKVSSRFELPDLGQLNQTAKKGWENYYRSKNTLKIAAKRYAKDLQFFDYLNEYRRVCRNIDRMQGIIK